ncbi:hypothetical protein H2201_006426 [Coniosporium apollinis]|uniref:Uncharacterized protein n=1 Tax=Coniosporium apollinis TaxID=61459 RepID=A0ABQ9NLT2_9PEZI|nr:hypothetical protein H2201_006426 [Coniosporium apollinis]
MSSSAFTLSAPPNTDIWRKPPATDRYNCPTKLSAPKPLKLFKSARITFSAAWVQQYDQGGLLLQFSHPSAPNVFGKKDTPPKWLKTGVEFYYGKPYVSTVGCDRFADWSIFPVTEEGPVTLEARREGDEHGKSLWIYQLVLGKESEVVERKPLREVGWFFADEKDGGWEVAVGTYACRPAKGDCGELEVKFSDLQAEWK